MAGAGEAKRLAIGYIGWQEIPANARRAEEAAQQFDQGMQQYPAEIPQGEQELEVDAAAPSTAAHAVTHRSRGKPR